MSWITAVALLALAAEKPAAVRFDRSDLEKLPAGWKAEQTGEGKGSEWKVVADPTAPSGSGHVLAQTAAGPSRLFNVCVLEKTSHQDVEITVGFKAVRGRIDQGGGVAWRYQDSGNYYICRYNPLEDNVRLYKVVKGKRIQLATEEGLTLPAGKWHTLTIVQKADRIECRLNGKKHLEVKDDTLTKAGKVALWTKADAQTYFDGLVIKPLD